MNKAITLLFLILPTVASANCVGTGSFKSCYDDSGNSYTVSQFGNTTSVNGYNGSTGNTWGKNSTRVGNSTFTNGYDSDGNNWNSTSTKIGDSTYTTGTDSDGNPFSSTCNEYGCY